MRVFLRNTMQFLFASILAASAFAGGPNGDVAASRSKGAAEPLNQRLIVKMKTSFIQGITAQASGEISAAAFATAAVASQRAGQTISAVRDMSGEAVVLSVAAPMRESELAEIAAQIATDPRVTYAQVDRRRQRLLAPNDPQYLSNQTHYQARSPSNLWGINAPTAWDITTGSTSVKIAVIDTGIVAHADLDVNVLPGYDMISDLNVANDGDLRDNNAADAGDWITAGEAAAGFFAGCDIGNSSWHGSHVAGTISAVSNNALGVAGVNWNAKIVPVRVLGKCGGFESDIIDGVRWAAGLTVPSVPVNANPVRVINMSLGGPGACSVAEQNAFNDATNAGVLVVVSAGNSNANLANFSPSNCNNVAAVTSLTSLGARSSFSNFGTGAFVAAPGSAVRSTINSGTQAPVASPGGDTYANYSGTSMAAPHVAGVAGLMLAANGALTVSQLRSLIAASAETFVVPTSGATCFGNTCGAGMLDAGGAVGLVANVNTARLALLTKTASGNEGTTVLLRVERSGDLTAAASVSYASTAGTAAAGSDFTAVSGSLTWGAGEGGIKTISLSLLTDAQNAETNEQFTVTLSGASGAAIHGGATSTVTIVNVVPCPAVALNATYANVAGTTASIANTDCTTGPSGPGFFADVYTVALAAGDFVTVQMSGFRSPAAALDTWLDLVDPTDSVVATNDDAAGGVVGSMIRRYVAPSAGTYKIYATTFDPGVVGTYQIVVSRDQACNLDMNGDSNVTSLIEGLIFVRSLMGMQSPGLLAGTGVSQSQWDAVRPVINASCGLSLAP